MASTGFFEQKSHGPGKFGLVLALHAAAIGGVLMIKGPTIIPIDRDPIDVTQIDLPPDPPRNPPEPQPKQVRQTLPPQLPYVPPVQVPTQPTGPTIQTAATGNLPTIPDGNGLGTDTTPTTPTVVTPPPHVPVRRDATILGGSSLQPPYPASEIRNEREGVVRVRVTIDESGRVIAVQQVSATSEAFFQATQRQALSRWRFRPATEDGRPVQSSQTLTVHFRLDGVG